MVKAEGLRANYLTITDTINFVRFHLEFLQERFDDFTLASHAAGTGRQCGFECELHMQVSERV